MFGNDVTVSPTIYGLHTVMYNRLNVISDLHVTVVELIVLVRVERMGYLRKHVCFKN